MKRIFSLALTLALALSLAAGASAAAEARLVRAFVYQDTLYTYVDISGADQPITKADAELGGRTFPASGTLETVRQAGFPVTWMLLVDNSNSMPPFREEAAAFAESLAAACGENTRFLLASFGDSFSLLAEDVPAEQLAARMADIPMDETVTRLHSSISQALDCFDGMPRTGNELRGLIVLSDAVAYDPGASVSYEELLERINASDVMLHSVGFGTDTAALDSLASLTDASGGVHQVVGSGLPAAEAGAALAEETGRLYVTSFSLSGLAPEQETAPVSITFASGGELVCRGSTEVSFPASAGGEEAEQPETPPEPVLPPSTASSSSGTSAAAEEPAPQPSPGLSLDADVLIPLIGLAVLLVAAVAALLLRRKRSAPEPPASSGAAEDAPPAGGPQDPSGIFVRLEVLQGAYLSQRLEFTLQRELVIGRDPGCDIPFADGSVSRRHSRVFLANDVVYIEDLGSQNGTQLNGSRIEMAHILRSGDAITAGDVTFKLKF